VSDPSLRFSHQRPDSNVGQERHFALPIKSSVLLRVSMGDGAESARTASAQGKAMAQPKEARVYPGRHEHLPSPLPIKNDILMKVQGMQEASLGDQNNGRSLDDPKLSRGSHDHTAMKNAPAPRDARVYPGRHEHIPSVPEMFMTHGKTQSQSNDSPGDKDAA
jgi:hypothetical protein